MAPPLLRQVTRKREPFGEFCWKLPPPIPIPPPLPFLALHIWQAEEKKAMAAAAKAMDQNHPNSSQSSGCPDLGSGRVAGDTWATNIRRRMPVCFKKKRGTKHSCLSDFETNSFFRLGCLLCFLHAFFWAQKTGWGWTKTTSQYFHLLSVYLLASRNPLVSLVSAFRPPPARLQLDRMGGKQS